MSRSFNPTIQTIRAAANFMLALKELAPALASDIVILRHGSGIRDRTNFAGKWQAMCLPYKLQRSLDFARDDLIRDRELNHFISSTERLRLISRVILRWRCAGMPVTRRGRILPLSVTNFFNRSGFL